MFSTSIVVLVAVLLLTGLQAWVNLRQPAPYMDELFHVPQAREFCDAFMHKRLPRYDSSITTPPALYIPNAILAILFQNMTVCETHWLRLTSAVMSFFSLLLMVDVLRICTERRKGHHGSSVTESFLMVDEVIWLLAFIIWLHPVNLFYANLFYTDTTSLFWVLMFWRTNLTKSSFLSASFGVLGSLSRQTNMIWHAYLALDTFLYTNILQSGSDIYTYASRLVRDNPFHAIAGLAYIAFVALNKGIALGDKSHHEMTMHYAMFAYFAAFHGSIFALIQVSTPWESLKMVCDVFSSFKLMTLLLSVCAALTGMVLATGDKVHPFILSDNRHFTFYIYRRWLLRSMWRRISLAPIYGWFLANPFLEANIAFGTRRRQNKHSFNSEHHENWMRKADFISDLALLACVYITLVPASLLEPRYFVVGCTLFCMRRASRLQHSPSKNILRSISVGMVLLNIAFVFVFAELPFPRAIDRHMPNDTSPGRFMF